MDEFVRLQISTVESCNKATFAVVYKATLPTPSDVRTALRNLKACREAGAITESDFDSYQTALVAKL